MGGPRRRVARRHSVFGSVFGQNRVVSASRGY
jgi:hypothetical protein